MYESLMFLFGLLFSFLYLFELFIHNKWAWLIQQSIPVNLSLTLLFRFLLLLYCLYFRLLSLLLWYVFLISFFILFLWWFTCNYLTSLHSKSHVIWAKSRSTFIQMKWHILSPIFPKIKSLFYLIVMQSALMRQISINGKVVNLSRQFLLLKKSVREDIHMIEIIKKIYIKYKIPFPNYPKLTIHITLN
jgi:hypothetical protein